MRWRLLLILPFVVGSMGIDCSLSEECDPETDLGCEPPVLRDGGIDEEPSSSMQSYHYVLVRDQSSDGSSSGTNGADIDGVGLIRGSSPQVYADNYQDFVLGPNLGSLTTTVNPEEVLGPPQSETGDCGEDDSFFLTLGLGGAIIVSFDNLLEVLEGDVIRIYACMPESELVAYEILIGVEPTRDDPHWVPCGQLMSGVGECIVPPLPKIPAQ